VWYIGCCPRHCRFESLQRHRPLPGFNPRVPGLIILTPIRPKLYAICFSPSIIEVKNANSRMFTSSACIYIFPEDGVGLVPKRGCLLTLAYYASPRWYEFGERRWNDILTGENRRTRRKTCPSATLPTTNPTSLTPARTWASAVRGRRLTTWAMAQTVFTTQKQLYLKGKESRLKSFEDRGTACDCEPGALTCGSWYKKLGSLLDYMHIKWELYSSGSGGSNDV
jgi:hypothetical protein